MHNAKILADSISKKSKLECLGGKIGARSPKSTAIVALSLHNLVCNLSSFESLCRSNRKLGKIGEHAGVILLKRDKNLERQLQSMSGQYSEYQLAKDQESNLVHCTSKGGSMCIHSLIWK